MPLDDFVYMNCPVRWYCKNLDKEVFVSKNAVYSFYGWICECSCWIRSNDKRHIVVLYDLREAFLVKK